MEQKDLIIVRGIPGSGKTTFASLLSNDVCCADDYHMVDGEYKWKAENQGYAHKSCQNKCKAQMESGKPTVVVANTSTTIKEMNPYIDMAETYGYRVFTVIVENRHGGINEHNVPSDTLNAMEKRFNIKLR
jgi:predicted kinase